MSKRHNPELIDDENPEWTDEESERARPFCALPATLQSKQPTTIRFDAEVLAGLRATGPGSQARVNMVLRYALAKGRLRA